MVKIVAISDTHGKHGYIHGLDKIEADILLCAGDFTNTGETGLIIDFNKWLGELTNIKHKIIIPGNHELTFEKNWNYAKSLVTNATVLNQQIIEVEGLKIYGEPRQPEFFNWAFNIPRTQMKEVWDKAPTNIDLLLTHGPPLKCKDKNSEGEHCGCYYLREWIKKNQPKAVVCGHIHEGYGRAKIKNTVIINASICDGMYRPTRKPIIFEI